MSIAAGPHREPLCGHPAAAVALGRLRLHHWTSRHSLHQLHVAGQSKWKFSTHLRETSLSRSERSDLWWFCLQRFGPPDQPYYYKKSDDLQPDDPHSAAWSDSTDRKGNASLVLHFVDCCRKLVSSSSVSCVCSEETVGAAARRREPLGKQKKSDLDLKVKLWRSTAAYSQNH